MPLVRLGNPVLRKNAKRVTTAYLKSPAFKELERSLIRTMRKKDGVGIAAPQIGVPLQVAVLEMHPTTTRPDLPHRGPITIVNPKILSYGPPDSFGWEGCLSIPGIRGKLRRAKSLRVSYIDTSGTKVEETVTGFWAHMFQHEIDHLNGILYVDRMEDLSSLMDLEEFQERILSKKGTGHT